MIESARCPSKRVASPADSPQKTVRCAILTRKSVEGSVEEEFSSIDAQRESCESWVSSQKHEGWTCLPDRYDDLGYSGGSMNRPGLTRLLADVEAGRVDCIVVYKIDRLTRSLLDFSRIVEVLNRHSVSFVAVTQHFNSSTPEGRLLLNILLTFAQFEREMIVARTRDKMSAARRRGKYAGGVAVLGYDVVDKKLIVNEPEADRVREIFRLFLARDSVIATVRELNDRGWTTKALVSRNGRRRGTFPWDRSRLYFLLTNSTYAGKVLHRGELYAGEQVPIVDEDLWNQVQERLRRPPTNRRLESPNRHRLLLRGILRCGSCNSAMTPSFTARGSKTYRYYVCGKTQKQGRGSCPTRSVPAGEIERFVVEHLRRIGSDPTLAAETIRRTAELVDARGEELRREREILLKELRSHHDAVRRLLREVDRDEVDTSRTARLADLQDRVRTGELRLEAIGGELGELESRAVTAREVRGALGQFDLVWQRLETREQVRAIQLLLERVVYDRPQGTLAMTFHPSGIRALAEGAGREAIAS